MKLNPSSAVFLSSLSNKTLMYLLIAIFCIVSGCGKKDNPSGAVNTSQDVKSGQSVDTGDNSTYMSEAGWKQAQAELKTVEEVIKAFNGFYDIWGWAYEHLVFLRFKEALETADYLPGKINEAEKVVGTIRSVPGYGEIDEMKKCYLEMIPLLRSGSESLKKSIIAARDKNKAEEDKEVKIYTEKWKKAMEYSRKSFAIMQDILIRGSRAAYRKMAGESKPPSLTAPSFRTVIRKIASGYDSSIMKKIDVIKKLAPKAQWDDVLAKIDDVTPVLQASIMEAGQADPGNKKEFWDARQELVSMLSYQMMAMKKFREYAEKVKAGNSQEAEQAKKVYEILRKSASDSHNKLKKTGYL